MVFCCGKRFEARNEVLSINVGLTDRPVSNVPRSQGVFVELFTVMIWLSFFGLRCTARRKLEIYNL